MVERFFFNRVDTKTGGAAVGSQDYLVADVLPNKTGATLAFMQFAVARAKIALDARRFAFYVRKCVPPAREMG